jgi:hypothetical protein
VEHRFDIESEDRPKFQQKWILEDSAARFMTSGVGPKISIVGPHRGSAFADTAGRDSKRGSYCCLVNGSDYRMPTAKPYAALDGDEQTEGPDGAVVEMAQQVNVNVVEKISLCFR